jgi:hypothetical protein
MPRVQKVHRIMAKVRGSVIRLGADAANISVIDAGQVDKAPPTEYACKKYSPGPGKYKIKIFIADTWNGKRSKTKVINVPSGSFYVSDLCYLFDNGWQEFLDRTQYLEREDEYFMCLFTGGDGQFRVRVEYELISDKVKKSA